MGIQGRRLSGRHLGGGHRILIEVVSLATVVGDVKAQNLLIDGHTQDAGRLHDHEDAANKGAHPGHDGENTQELAAQELPPTAEEHTVLNLARGSVRLNHVLLAREQSDHDHTESAAEAVHGRGTQGVVNLKLQQHSAAQVEEDPGERADQQGSGGVNHGAAGGDAHKSRENTVARLGQVPSLGLAEVPHERRHTAGGSGDGGRHRSAGHGLDRTVDGEHGAGVEPVPAEPQDKGSEHNQRHGVSLEVGARGAIALETPAPRADDRGAHEPSKATSHVHNTAAGEIDHAAVPHKRIRVERAQPTLGGPDPVRHDGVYEAREEHRVDDVGLERAALSNRAADYGGSGSSERPLEDEEWPIGEVVEEEIVVADEAVGGGPLTVRESVAEGPVHGSTEARIQDVLQEDVHAVLAADGPSAQHGKARLHEKHQVGVGQHEAAIQRAADAVGSLLGGLRTRLHGAEHFCEVVNSICHPDITENFPHGGGAVRREIIHYRHVRIHDCLLSQSLPVWLTGCSGVRVVC
mmetsp:Transcript_36817/g.80213  ORF Transcript_36817/g.80213 Transcript_36817/m.80213 type:complete len:521 (+) Transcript_36817:126-1688(+)